MTRRRVTAAPAAVVTGIVAGVLALTAAGPAAAATATATAAPRGFDAAPLGTPTGQVLVVAVPDLRWSDLSPAGTPTLWSLASTGAAGSLTVKTDRDVAGCADGLLTLAAGDREQAEPAGAPCSAARPGGSTALAIALGTAGVLVAPQGPGAGALLQGTTQVPASRAGLTLAVDDALLTARGPARAAAVRAVDGEIRTLSAALTGDGTVLVVGSSDDPSSDRAHLHVAIAHGPGFPAGLLDSPSTRRAPYVELIDVAPTVLELLGLPVPAEMTGRGWRPVAGGGTVADRVARLQDLDVRAVRVAYWRPPFQWALAVAALLVGLAALALLGRPGGVGAGGTVGSAGRARTAVAAAGYTVAALPLASWLLQPVPWWRGSAVVLWLLLLAVAGTVGAAATALARRHPLLGVWTVTGATAAVLLADLVTGSRLQSAALLGDSPLTAGRFFGAGNTAFGALAAAGLLATGTLAGALATRRGRRVAVPVAAPALLVLVAVDGAPTFGADFGGVLALGPAALVLLVLLAGVRMSAARWLALLAAGAVPTVAVALGDFSRPPERRTHIGRFVAQLLDGSAGQVLARKEAANLGQLTGSPYLPLVLGTLLVAAWLLTRRPAWARAAWSRLVAVPGMPAALAGVGVAALIGTLLNDSGVAVAGIMATVVIPSLAALAVRTSPAP